MVCRLKKLLYGPEKETLSKCANMDSFLLSHGFSYYHSDPKVYIFWKYDTLLYEFLYVDDLLITSRSQESIAAVKYTLHDSFLMSDLGILNYFLNIGITNYDSRIIMA